MTSTNIVTHIDGAVVTLGVTLSDDARAFAAASLARNTRRAYSAQWKLWQAHCDLLGIASVPAHPAAVANWLAQRALTAPAGGKRRGEGASGQAIATLRTALAAVKAAHEAQGIAFDTGAPELRMTMKGIRRERAEKIAKAEPLRADMLIEVIGGLGNSPLELRDAALLALGYCFARRRSELTGLDLERLGEGDGVFVSDERMLAVTLVRHKTQAAEPLVTAIPRDCNAVAVRAIEAWLAIAGVKPGQPILRRVLKGGKVGADRLNAQSVTGIIQRRVAEHYARTALPADKVLVVAKRYSGHSLRHGFATTAAEAGASVQAIMSVTGHKSVPVVMGYVSQAEKSRISPHRIKGVGLADE